jgi:hypothetical protein
MDEGMPWGIIMLFFLAGALLGISTEIEMRKKAAKNIEKLDKQEEN